MILFEMMMLMRRLIMMMIMMVIMLRMSLMIIIINIKINVSIAYYYLSNRTGPDGATYYSVFVKVPPGSNPNIVQPLQKYLDNHNNHIYPGSKEKVFIVSVSVNNPGTCTPSHHNKLYLAHVQHNTKLTRKHKFGGNKFNEKKELKWLLCKNSNTEKYV